MSDLQAVLVWWFFLTVIGMAVWPIVWMWFAKFWDRGYGLMKTAGLAVNGWLVWELAVFKVVPFSVFNIWVVIFLLSILGWIVIWPEKSKFIDWHKKSWRIILFEEALFLVALGVWSVVRGYQPDIEGLEKFMDFGFMNSVLRSRFFPPVDMWWAGETINYYYFGHFLAGMVTKLSGIDSSITYNLAIAQLFAMGVSGTFSIGSNLVYRLAGAGKRIGGNAIVAGGILAAFLFNLAGNWHTIYAFLSPYNADKPMPPWKLAWNLDFSQYWYPNATRFIPYTIHEFPIYSYVVADLHGHVSDISFALLFMALVLHWEWAKTYCRSLREKLVRLFPIGFLLGIMMMTNYWDLPIYGLLFGISVFILESRERDLYRAGVESLIQGMFVLLISFSASAGFVLNFKQIAQGVDFVHARSALYQLFILWGWPLMLSVLFGWWMVTHREKNRIQSIDMLICGWLALAWFLVLVPEVIYVKDIYIADYHRANTMFKLVYQSFGIFALTGTYIIVRILKGTEKTARKIIAVILLPGFALVSIYPWFSIRSYYGNLKSYKGLYGMKFLEKSPGDLAGIYWLKDNINGQPVVLEAPGDSYTIYDRVSAMTGLPTIAGWTVHEWLWRGGYGQVATRNGEVEKIYTGEELSESRLLLLKYGVQYIFVGEKEREKYEDRLNEITLAKLGKIVFNYAGTKIYKVD